jgi:hypothetical protein
MNLFVGLIGLAIGTFCCRRDRSYHYPPKGVKWVIVSACNDVKAVDSLPRFYVVWVSSDPPETDTDSHLSRLGGIRTMIDRKDGTKFMSYQFETDKMETVMMIVGVTRILSYSKFCYGHGN